MVHDPMVRAPSLFRPPVVEVTGTGFLLMPKSLSTLILCQNKVNLLDKSSGNFLLARPIASLQRLVGKAAHTPRFRVPGGFEVRANRT
jgi:hypothetical protein